MYYLVDKKHFSFQAIRLNLLEMSQPKMHKCIFFSVYAFCLEIKWVSANLNETAMGLLFGVTLSLWNCNRGQFPTAPVRPIPLPAILSKKKMTVMGETL